MQSIANYHTHTWRCMHARGTEEQYVETAVAQGFKVLGFSDHTPWPYKTDFVANMRMRLDQFEGYRKTIRALQEKYCDRISIPLGLECEAFPEYFGWLQDFKAAHLDYVLLGNHYDYTDDGDQTHLSAQGGFYLGCCTRPEEARRYGERTIAGIETGLYDCVAHPDLFLNIYPHFDDDCRAVSRDLCQAAKAYGVPLEYNLLGYMRQRDPRRRAGLGYPCSKFWEIAAQTGCQAIVGFDAHMPAALEHVELYDEARRTLTRMGIQVCTYLPGLEPESSLDECEIN